MTSDNAEPTIWSSLVVNDVYKIEWLVKSVTLTLKFICGLFLD